MDAKLKAEEIDFYLQKHGLTVESEFIPWSRSRNAGEKDPSLNWKVTLKQNGRKILTTDYSAGMGHAPFYKKVNHMRLLVWQHEEIVRECETGFPVTSAKIDSAMGIARQDKNRPILPDSKDVIYSLLMDAEVLHYSEFEEWAGDFGYDPDSRSDEKIYQACLKIALQFNRLGESVIAELREAFQDY